MKEQVVKEKQELDQKIEKLVLFMQSSEFNALTNTKQMQYIHQEFVMRQYSSILADRIDDFDVESKDKPKSSIKFGITEMKEFASNHDDPRVKAIWKRLVEARRKNALFNEKILGLEKQIALGWTKGELIKWVKNRAVEYRKDAVKSINRNSHMNELNGECKLYQDEVDALLTDFVNMIGVYLGVDYAMYTTDFAIDKGDL